VAVSASRAKHAGLQLRPGISSCRPGGRLHGRTIYQAGWAAVGEPELVELQLVNRQVPVSREPGCK